MNIFLTGSTGFLGLALAEKLIEQGHQVFGLVRANSSVEKKNKLKNLGATLISSDSYIDTLSLYEIDCVVHTATNYGRNNPILSEIFESNLILPLQILKDIAKTGKNITFINTDSSFNKDNYIYSPLIDYSLSKKSLLDWLIYFSNQLPIVNMRIELMYGPNDGVDRFISSIIKKLLDPQTQKINLSPGLQIRDFIYISDVVDAFSLLIENVTGERQHNFIEYQIGTGVGITIKDLVQQIATISESKAELIFGALNYRQNEIMSSVSDKSFQYEFNWEHKISVAEGLSKIIVK